MKELGEAHFYLLPLIIASTKTGMVKPQPACFLALTPDCAELMVSVSGSYFLHTVTFSWSSPHSTPHLQGLRLPGRGGRGMEFQTKLALESYLLKGTAMSQAAAAASRESQNILACCALKGLVLRSSHSGQGPVRPVP